MFFMGAVPFSILSKANVETVELRKHFTGLLQEPTETLRDLSSTRILLASPDPLARGTRGQSHLWFKSLIAIAAAPFTWSRFFSGFAVFFTPRHLHFSYHPP